MSNEVSLPQACRIVGKSYQWVYSRVLSGELRGRQVNGRFWVEDRKSAERLGADAGRQSGVMTTGLLASVQALGTYAKRASSAARGDREVA